MFIKQFNLRVILTMRRFSVVFQGQCPGCLPRGALMQGFLLCRRILCFNWIFPAVKIQVQIQRLLLYRAFAEDGTDPLQRYPLHWCRRSCATSRKQIPTPPADTAEAISARDSDTHQTPLVRRQLKQCICCFPYILPVITHYVISPPRISPV